MTLQTPTFIITREDQVVDPVTLSTQALRVGRQTDCEILLNHPTVSRLHAGINVVEGRFYLINLSSSHPVTLNGRLVELSDAEALADGDVAQIGSFFLQMSRVGDALNINVQVQVAGNIAEVKDDAAQEHPMVPETATTSPQVADALKEFWDKRTRDKAARPSPLHPRRPTRPGKSQFNWAPTKDLLHPWRSSIFVWALIVVGTISIAAAFWYAKAFSPAPLSRPHVQSSLVHSAPDSAIAKQPNANACTTCHTLSIPMEVNCASCHQTAAFAAGLSGIPAHAEAGIGCVSCHAEHLGADFLPAEAAVTACAKCHNDKNKEHYHGRRVSTPHGGTVGYPVKAGTWTWKGLSDDEWNQRPDASTESIKRVRTRLPNETEDKWRSRQFHILHLYRVVAREVGLPGDDAGAMSCSSCHKSFDPIDRATPATTCARCHNGDRGLASISGKGLLIDAGSPNCISCHVQHVRQTRHWKLGAGSGTP
jgi:hypothetical protein